MFIKPKKNNSAQKRQKRSEQVEYTARTLRSAKLLTQIQSLRDEVLMGKQFVFCFLFFHFVHTEMFHCFNSL